MIKNSTSRSEFKKHVLSKSLVEYKCKCGNKGEWEGKPLTLQLDHIDGNSSNNAISNLRFLCPNCHAQTPTFCQSKIRVSVGYVEFEKLVLSVVGDCNSLREILSKIGKEDRGHYYSRVYRVFSRNNNHPGVIAFKGRQKLRRHEPKFQQRKVIDRPSESHLRSLVATTPLTDIAKSFGLKSSNSVKKWCSQYHIETKPRGYWGRGRMVSVTGIAPVSQPSQS